MKKKEMLRSCIASFLTGSMSIIAQAHGVVGLSDSPVASAVRHAASSSQAPAENVNRSVNTNRPQPVVQENRETRTSQESTTNLNIREPIREDSDYQSGQVRIIRSGYHPEHGRRPETQPSSTINRSSDEHQNQIMDQQLSQDTAPFEGVIEQRGQPEPTPSVVSRPPSILSDEILSNQVEEASYSPAAVQQVTEVDAMEAEVVFPETVIPETVIPEMVEHEAVQLRVAHSAPATDQVRSAPVLSEQSQTHDVVSESPFETMPLAGEMHVSDSIAENQPTVEVPVNSMTTAPAIQTFDLQLNEPTGPNSASPASPNGGGMSIEDIVQRAIGWHPSITEALGRLYQQGEQVSVARAGYFPQISAGVSTEHRTSTGRSEDAFNVSASQMLYDFGRVSSEIEAARFGVDRDQALVWLAMDQLARDTAQAAIEIQRFSSLIDIAGEQIAGVNDIRELAERRSALGASTRSDEIQAQSRLELANATKQQLEAQLKTWENTLRTLIGVSGSFSVNQEFPQYLTQSCALASDDFDDVPELMVAEAQEAEARAIIEQTQASFFPTASLDAGFNQFLNNSLIEDDNEVTVRFNLTSNLYQGGATSARRRAADFSLQASQAARDSAYLSLSRSLSEAKEQTVSFALRLTTLDARARSIRETQSLYRQQYLSLGTRSLLDLLNAEQEIHQSRFDQENTRYDLYRLQIDCLYSAADIREAFNLEDSMVQGVSVIP